MKWMKRIGTGVAVGAALLITVLAVAIYRDTHPPAHVYQTADSNTLTEPEAIDFTRRAISDSGRKADEYTMLAWGTREQHGTPERVLARNAIDPNRGYVIWQHTGADPAKTVHVVIEKHDRTLECWVHKVK